MRSSTDNKGISVVVILLLMAVVLAVAFYFIWKSITPAQVVVESLDENTTRDAQITLINTPTPKASVKPTPTPTPVPLKPDDGTKGTYQVGMGAHDGPTITQVIFDPLDAKKGQSVSFSVKANFSSAISSLTAVLTTDHGTQSVDFSLSSGSATDGQWNGTITLNDSVDYKYILAITAKSSNGKSSTATVAPRS